MFSMQGRNIFNLWFIDPDLGVFMAVTRERKVIVPVLEFDKIGEGGDFTGPFTYSLQYTRYEGLRGDCHVSRNKVPKAIKDYFRAFYRSKEERRDGVKQEEVGIS